MVFLVAGEQAVFVFGLMWRSNASRSDNLVPSHVILLWRIIKSPHA
jgi:hypothetical protein